MALFLTGAEADLYRIGAVLYFPRRRRLCSMRDARAIDLTKQEALFLSHLVARMGTVATPDEHACACAPDPTEGNVRPDRHHLRVLAERIRNKFELVAPGASRHLLTAVGGGYVVAEDEDEVNRLRDSGLYLARGDFKRPRAR